MSRWLERALAGLECEPTVPSVPNVPKSTPSSSFGTFGTYGAEVEKAHTGCAHRNRTADVDQLEERAAFIEGGGLVPRNWAEGFAKLDVMAPPLGFPVSRWRQLIDDGGRFLDNWAQEAAALGWYVEDVFGVDGVDPDSGYEAMGLVAMIRGGVVTRITKCMAVIQQKGGELLVYMRRRSRGTVPIWHLVTGTPNSRKSQPRSCFRS